AHWNRRCRTRCCYARRSFFVPLLRPAMTRRWPLLLPATLLLGSLGCVNLRQDPAATTSPAQEAKRDPDVSPAAYQAIDKVTATQTRLAASSEAALAVPDLGGPQPLDVL